MCCFEEKTILGLVRGVCNFVALLMVLGLYGLIGAHFYAFIYVVCPLIK